MYVMPELISAGRIETCHKSDVSNPANTFQPEQSLQPSLPANNPLYYVSK